MTVDAGDAPVTLQGKYTATLFCWILGFGSLLPWYSLLTVGDYYYQVFPSFFAGLAASGAMTSGLRLILKAAFENANHGLRKGALLFLAISTFFEFICVILYATLFAKLPIVKYYRAKAASQGSKTVSADLAADGIQTPDDESNEVTRLSTKKLLFQNVDYCLDLYIIFTLTLSIFPWFLYENIGKHQLGAWYSLVLIAMFTCLTSLGGAGAECTGGFAGDVSPMRFLLRSFLGLVVADRS